jgi:hypothetical protein
MILEYLILYNNSQDIYHVLTNKEHMAIWVLKCRVCNKIGQVWLIFIIMIYMHYKGLFLNYKKQIWVI